MTTANSEPVVFNRDNLFEPTWEIATLFPAQGQWSEAEYLALETNKLVEFSDGVLEFLPMPTISHQRIVKLLYRLLEQHIEKHNLGEVFFAPLRILLQSGKYREPDIVFIANENLGKRTDQYWIGADLVMEVVSPDNPDLDYVTKRAEYSQAGVSEYWIVDPVQRRITVLSLHGQSYQVVGEYTPSQSASSRFLAGFTVSVADVMSSGAG